MAIGAKGIDIRQGSGHIIFRASLKDSLGAKVTSGTTNVTLYEVQSDGTLKSYDWSDNTFKTGALTTENQAATHRTGNNGSTNTGVWTAALSTLTGFTAGGVYLVVFSNTLATPAQQEREFQFGGGALADVVQIGNDTQSATDLKDLVDDGYDPSTNTLTEVAALTTFSTARQGAIDDLIDGGRLDLLIDAIKLCTDRLTANRAQVIDDWLDGGRLDLILDSRASSTEVTSIQNNTRVVRVVPNVIERPDSGTVTYRIELLLYDSVGNMEAPDSAPTIALVNQSGTDLSARLDSATMALVSTGRYRAIYTASAGDTLEQLVWAFSVVEGGATRIYGNTSIIVDTTAVDFTAADRTKLERLDTDYTTARAVKIDNLDATVSSRPSAAAIAAAVRDVDNSAPAAGSLGEAARGADAKAADIQITLGVAGAGLTGIPKTGYSLTAAYDLYHADIQFTRDEANSTDEYTITWFKNGVRVTSGITVPTIQVAKRADGSDLIAATAPTEIASTGTFKHDATGSGRVTVGEAVLVLVGATIDGSARTFSRLIGRDST